MGGLFDLPTSRSNKQSDKSAVKKSTNKKSSGIVIKGGNSLLDKITGINALVESKIGKYKDDYIYYMADDESKFKEYIYNIKQLGDCSFDTETMGLNPITDQIVGFSLYSKGQKGLYVPLHHKSYITGMEVEGQIDTRIVTEQLQLLVDAGVKFKGYNAKFDRRVAQNWLSVTIPFWFDAHLAAMCLDENEPHGLKQLHSKYVLQGKEDEFSFGKLFEGITFDLVPIKTGYIYAARDAVDTDELVDFQLPYLTTDNELCIENDLQGVANVFWNIEMPYLDVTAELEQNGVEIDTEYAETLSEKYHAIEQEKLQAYYDELDKYSDIINDYKLKHPNHKLSDPVLVTSPTQLAVLFYDILKVGVIDKKNPRGTGEEILEKIDLPICKRILEYRGVSKLLSTYIDAIPNMLLDDHRVHCNFNQYGAKTGRLSSDEPNLQNIPLHNKNIRKIWENYARIFKLPALSVGDRGLVQREYEDLDKSISELAQAGKLPFIASGKFP
jgi:DNA polymerase-1